MRLSRVSWEGTERKLQKHTLNARLSCFSDLASLTMVAPISSPRIVWRRVSPSRARSYFPMCVETAAADVAIASDNFTFSGSSLPWNSFSFGLQSRRSMSVGDMIKSSYFSWHSWLFFQRLTTMLDKYSGFIPFRSANVRALVSAAFSSLFSVRHAHIGQMSVRPMPEHRVSPRPSLW